MNNGPRQMKSDSKKSTLMAIVQLVNAMQTTIAYQLNYTDSTQTTYRYFPTFPRQPNNHQLTNTKTKA